MANKKSESSNIKKRPLKDKTLNLKQQISITDKWFVLFCAAILIAAPLAVSLISRDRFDIVKLAALRFLVAGLVFVWAAKYWRKPKQIIWSWREVLLAVFLLFLVISTLISIHIPTSIFGKYKRYEGLLTFITYITMYFVVLQIFKNKGQIRFLIEITSVTGGVVAFYGLLQYFGLDLVNWGAAAFGVRSFSTLGNPNFLAGYLVLAFPCAIAAYLNNTKRRWLHWFMVLLIWSCLYTSFTRGGWVGAMIALVCFAALLGRRVIKDNWRETVILSASLIIALALLIVFSSSILMSRLTPVINSKSNFSGSSEFTRFEIWKTGLKMIRDRPFFGQGPDTFMLASEHFQTKQLVRMVDGKVVADNAHNYFIQLASTVGLPATVLIYIFFVSWIIRAIGLRRKINDDEGRVLISAMAAVFIGYLITMFFELSVVGAASVFWLLMAITAGYASQIEPVCKVKQTVPAGRQVRRWPRSLNLVLITSIVILTTVNAGIAATMYAGDIYFEKGIRAESMNPKPASEYFNKAAALYPVNGRIMYKKGRMYDYLIRKAANSKDEKKFKLYSQEAIESFNKANLAEPLEIRNIYYLAVTCKDMGRIKDAKKILDLVLARSPYYVFAHMLYGSLEEAQGHDAKALNHYETVAGLTSTLAYPKVYSHMAKLYRKAGNTKKAAIYETAVRLNKPVNR